MAVDTQHKRQACVSLAQPTRFQGPTPGEGTAAIDIRVMMAYCYPFEHMAISQLLIGGIKWLGDKVWLADRKAAAERLRKKQAREQRLTTPKREQRKPRPRYVRFVGEIQSAQSS